MAAAGKCILVTGPPAVGKTTLIIKVLETLKTSHPNFKVQGFYTREIRQGSERVGFEVVTLDGRRGPLASTTNSSLKHLLPCSPESFKWPTVGRYKVDVSSFELVALPELQIREGKSVFSTLKSQKVDTSRIHSSTPFYVFYSMLSQNQMIQSPYVNLLLGLDAWSRSKFLVVKEDTDLFIIDEIGKMELYSSSFFPAVLDILESNIPLLASIPIPKGGRDIPGVARLRNHPGATIFTLNTSNRDAIKLKHLLPCSPESFKWPTVGRYKVDVSSFELVALPELLVEIREAKSVFSALKSPKVDMSRIHLSTPFYLFYSMLTQNQTIQSLYVNLLVGLEAWSRSKILVVEMTKVKEDTDLFIIDEIGKMELYSSSFFPAVLNILESNIPLLASIPIPKGGRDIPGVARLRNHPGATIFTLNTGNMDAVKERIYSQLVNLLQKH
ncbi:unnamed protein product [Camellia sinensis]